MPRHAALESVMATDFAKAPLLSHGASSPRQRAAASALGRLAGLLARQAAREVIASVSVFADSTKKNSLRTLAQPTRQAE